jgi:hypothetical protein
MKTIKNFNTIIGMMILFSYIFSSCSSSKVITGSFIQKRKYNQGFYCDFFTSSGKRAFHSDSKKNAIVSESIPEEPSRFSDPELA